MGAHINDVTYRVRNGNVLHYMLTRYYTSIEIDDVCLLRERASERVRATSCAMRQRISRNCILPRSSSRSSGYWK